ncbi:hypothetical protein B296_00006045 [Ensete ventricosum]|uniref:Uncharacterized protein n=1 Tax=Ensete ventricosum TaxID=4639 RepID=A0A427AQE5_ENSVE|nr:hypothetical protein B296_00006045 [Ensete ventricosum]
MMSLREQVDHIAVGTLAKGVMWRTELVTLRAYLMRGDKRNGIRLGSVAEMTEVVEDDAEFLSLLEAAEAAAVGGSAKRQKLSSYSSSSVASIPAVEEGSYMAALRGSHSSLWQQQLKLSQKKGNNSGGLRTGSNPPHSSSSTTGGACFKCGMAGHWARDCDAARGREQGGGSVSEGGFVGREDDRVPEKACPCGSGTCLVRTSNTAKNPGRKFYTCPLKLVSITPFRIHLDSDMRITCLLFFLK